MWHRLSTRGRHKDTLDSLPPPPLPQPNRGSQRNLGKSANTPGRHHSLSPNRLTPQRPWCSWFPRAAASRYRLRLFTGRGDQCPEAAFSSPLTSQGMSILCALVLKEKPRGRQRRGQQGQGTQGSGGRNETSRPAELPASHCPDPDTRLPLAFGISSMPDTGAHRTCGALKTGPVVEFHDCAPRTGRWV